MWKAMPPNFDAKYQKWMPIVAQLAKLESHVSDVALKEILSSQPSMILEYAEVAFLAAALDVRLALRRFDNDAEGSWSLLSNALGCLVEIVPHAEYLDLLHRSNSTSWTNPLAKDILATSFRCCSTGQRAVLSKSNDLAFRCSDLELPTTVSSF